MLRNGLLSAHTSHMSRLVMCNPSCWKCGGMDCFRYIGHTCPNMWCPKKEITFVRHESVLRSTSLSVIYIWKWAGKSQNCVQNAMWWRCVSKTMKGFFEMNSWNTWFSKNHTGLPPACDHVEIISQWKQNRSVSSNWGGRAMQVLPRLHGSQRGSHFAKSVARWQYTTWKPRTQMFTHCTEMDPAVAQHSSPTLLYNFSLPQFFQHFCKTVVYNNCVPLSFPTFL